MLQLQLENLHHARSDVENVVHFGAATLTCDTAQLDWPCAELTWRNVGSFNNVEGPYGQRQ